MRLRSRCAGSRSEEHVGEWKVSVWATTLPSLFKEVARVIARASGPTHGPPTAWERVELPASDVGTLLAEWANELLGRSEITQLAYWESRHLRITRGGLSGEIRGRPVISWRSPMKAAAYHGLAVERHRGRWRATILFDVRRPWTTT
jgi:SHS2 domain-containing protein